MVGRNPADTWPADCCLCGIGHLALDPPICPPVPSVLNVGIWLEESHKGNDQAVLD